jgi:hypothetical protein
MLLLIEMYYALFFQTEAFHLSNAAFMTSSNSANLLESSRISVSPVVCVPSQASHHRHL